MLIIMTALCVIFPLWLYMLHIFESVENKKVLTVAGVAIFVYCLGVISYWNTGKMDSLPHEDIIYGDAHNMSHVYSELQSNFSLNKNSYLHEVLPNGDVSDVSPDSAIESIKVIRNEKDKYLVKMGLIDSDHKGNVTHRNAYAISDQQTLNQVKHNIFLTYQNDTMSDYQYSIPEKKEPISIEKKHEDMNFLNSVVNH